MNRRRNVENRRAAARNFAMQKERIDAQRRPYFSPHRNEHEWVDAFAATCPLQHQELAQDVRACVMWPSDPHFTDKRGAMARRIRSALQVATGLNDATRITIELLVGETCDASVFQSPVSYSRATSYLQPDH